LGDIVIDKTHESLTHARKTKKKKKKKGELSVALTKIYGVLGQPIEHSLSPAMQNAAFGSLGLEARYCAFNVGRPRLREAILGAEALGFGGLNLTIPLKEEALQVVRPDPTTEAMGAVNTIAFGDGIKGYNTDGIGAQMALEEAGADLPPFVMPPDGVSHLGEVIISYPQAVAQAEEQRHSVQREIAILIIHGVLHLLGYEHDKPEEEKEMRALQEKILGQVRS